MKLTKSLLREMILKEMGSPPGPKSADDLWDSVVDYMQDQRIRDGITRVMRSVIADHNLSEEEANHLPDLIGQAASFIANMQYDADVEDDEEDLF